MQILNMDIENAIREYGSPLFVILANTLRENVRLFREEFSSVYPKIEIAYSYKANSLLGLLRVLHKEGVWAEVASGFEYEIARLLGVPGGKIVFNGPYKRREELFRAVEDRALINVDHWKEIELLEEISSQAGRVIDIGVRVRINLGINSVDRFGFDLESGEAESVITRCVERKMLNVVGLHVHLTSYILEGDISKGSITARKIRLIWPKDHNLYRNALIKVVEFSNRLKERFGITLDYLDIGGGFPGIGEKLRDYVLAVSEPVLKGLREKLPTVILEPGRALVKNAMHLVATVVGIKQLGGGRIGVVVDAGINLLPTSLWSGQEVEALVENRGGGYEVILYGPLCLQTDIVAVTQLPELKAGDRLIVKNVGAYNFSQSTQFIFPRPAVLLVDDGKFEVIRRAETLEDLLAFEKL